MSRRIIWQPLPGSQEAALSCPCNHILYEGTRGPGKTDAQIMYFRRFVGLGYGPRWRGVIFDRSYKNLDDVVSKASRWYPMFGDGARWLASKSDYKWRWPTGEELLIRQFKKDSDYWNYHGQEFPFIGWNELSKYPTSAAYDLMMSCNRSSFIPHEHSPTDQKTGLKRLLPPIPLVVFSTTNPYGPGHGWVKRRFIDPAPPGEVIRVTTNVFNPQTQQREDIVRTQVRLFGSYKENRYLDPVYVAELESTKDPNRRRAWLWGDWDIVAGGALDDVWGDHVIVPRFKVPRGWRVDRSMDWGSSHPFSIGWWAEANGEEATMPDGSTWCPPRGSLVRVHEWYGTEEIGTNQGLKMSSRRVAQRIREIERSLIANGWIHSVSPGPADNSIGKRDDMEVDSPAKIMADEGVRWTPSDKSPGSRVRGLELVRSRLEASKTGENPGIFCCEHNRASIAILPVLPRDEDNPDDVDTDAEDHIWDEWRYRALASVRKIGPVDASFPT